MRRNIGIFLFAWMSLSVGAQQVLSLDSCRALALRNNKQLSVSKVKQDMAANLRKSARTKYLPHVSVVAGYEYMNKEVSLLNNEQKAVLNNLGTGFSASAQELLTTGMQSLPTALWQQLGQQGITPDMLQQQVGNDLSTLATTLNQTGGSIVDAFRTDTRHMMMGAVMVTQPVYMGGSIVAMNRMADIGGQMAVNSMEGKRQLTLYQTDQAYWQVVSLRHKQKLAESYLQLVRKLSDDVRKMIDEGIATRSEGLSVSVKVNEAEMTLLQVNDGLALSKMYLAQLCGLPVSDSLTLADEEAVSLDEVPSSANISTEVSAENRPELRMLQNTVELSKEATHLLKAGNLPQVALIGGYAVSNPNVYNGFEKKFSGVWNIGVLVRVPVWNWGDVAYKVRASKGATTIASLELDEAREKIELQVNQSLFKVDEAGKKLQMAEASTRRADENLRTANLGFREGVISSTTVMEAQTAWLQAQSQKIDAEIDVKLSQVNLRKALGTLR